MDNYSTFLSQISRHLVRTLVITGKVNPVKSGSKHLVDLNKMLEYLRSPPEEKKKQGTLSTTSKKNKRNIGCIQEHVMADSNCINIPVIIMSMVK
jgi:hypothetical protein